MRPSARRPPLNSNQPADPSESSSAPKSSPETSQDPSINELLQRSEGSPAQEERTFIHDLASPLATLQLVLGMLADVLEGHEGAPQRAKDLTKKGLNQAEKMTKKLQERREVLIQRSQPSK